MRPSLPRFIRILSRSQLKTEHPSVSPARLVPGPHRSDAKQPSLIELLQHKKQQAGAAYPQNIRIEPVLPKNALKKVSPEVRDELRQMLRER